MKLVSLFALRPFFPEKDTLGPLAAFETLYLNFNKLYDPGPGVAFEFSPILFELPNLY